MNNTIKESFIKSVTASIVEASKEPAAERTAATEVIRKVILKNLSRYYIFEDGAIYDRKKSRYLMQYLSRRGYYDVRVYFDNGDMKIVRVHRLVALAFCKNEKPEEYKIIDHISGVKTCNHASNLRWCDQTINMRNTVRNTERGLKILDLLDENMISKDDPMRAIYYQRLSKGWGLKKTLSTPLLADKDRYTKEGLEATRILVESGFTTEHPAYFTYHRRVKSGMTLEEARSIVVGRENKKSEEVKQLYALLASVNLDRSDKRFTTFLNRLRSGWSLERTLETPIKNRKRSSKAN
ncbi:HNH endonuclease [Hymenobacter canadensis]|uniref:HNH endonuclease n=1 Tax=Hymenobacter canadensis TaxID=2999067 RepID=A0ABY7LRX9_9BACT|nr:HNH endonuclease [Hymenobacter canadensis]WBA43175.1 HNH endonuclease [Hymenobacter canadensis]